MNPANSQQNSKGTTNKVGIKALQQGAHEGYGNPKGNNDGSTDRKGSVPKGVQAVNADSVKSTNPCRFWGTDGGCRRADKCKFVHTVLTSKENRCFGCSGTGHAKKDCPHMQPKESKKVAKSKVKGSPDKPSEAASVGGSETVEGSVKVGESSSSSAPADDQKKGSSTPPGDSTGGSQLDALLSEAALLMKSPRPSLKMVSLKKMEHGELATGLLDGGATNALRVGSPQELRNAIPVQVELAAGSIELYQDVQTGTLLSHQHVEPIVPVR